MSATNRGAARHAQDRYMTPSRVADLMTDRINWDRVGTFLEPCIGTGKILESVHRYNPLIAHSFAELDFGLDYLKTPFFKHDLCITNPPYHLAEQFLAKALTEAKTVCFLLRLNFLGSQKRREFWQGREPTHLFVLSDRPSFKPRPGSDKGPTDATEYAWFCWDHYNVVTRAPGIYVI